jgi:hypothetical protein
LSRLAHFKHEEEPLEIIQNKFNLR